LAYLIISKNIRTGIAQGKIPKNVFAIKKKEFDALIGSRDARKPKIFVTART